MQNLATELGGTPDFETLIAVALNREAQIPPGSPDHGKWLAAATLASQRVAKRLARPAVAVKIRAPVVPVLERLTQAFRTVVGTLNWDDLPLAARVAWWDGYDHDYGGSFAADFARHWRSRAPVLCWLHGSIHFAPHFSNTGRPRTEWEWKPHPQPDQWEIRPARGEGDTRLLDLPVITGRQKALQILSPPFDDYWLVWAQALRETSALLVIGYSARDVHVNARLHSAVHHNRALRTVVWVTFDPAPTPSAALRTTLARVFDLPSYQHAPTDSPSQGLYRFQLPAVSQLADWPETWVVTTGVEGLAAPSVLDAVVARLAGGNSDPP
jgi:hypothetical protein